MATNMLRVVGSVCFVATLWMPAIQCWTGAVVTVGLSGVEEPATRVELDWNTWSDGSWQQSWEASFDHGLGLRDWMVRIDNELQLRLLGVTKAPVHLGPDGWLVEAAYLPATHLVRHRVIAEKLLLKCLNLRLLQDALATRGITLMVVLSPSKCDVHPESMPLEFRVEHGALQGVDRHYDVIHRGLTLAGVHLVDGVQLARDMREAPGEAPPMFVAGGLHWTNYGAARCAVSLLDELERVSGNDIRNLDVADVRMEPEPDRGELDLAALANLLTTGRWRHPLGQPVVELREGDRGRPCGLLLVGTSFVWGLTHALKLHGATDPLTVFYYYRRRVEFIDGQQHDREPLSRTVEELIRELPRYRAVVLESNQVALLDLGHGFIETAIEACGLEPVQQLPVTVEQIMGHRYEW